MSWPEVAAGLAAARSYWLSTTMPSGAPHVAPVWGVVISDVLYLYSERLTRKARNLAADPRLVVHLESADDVVIVRISPGRTRGGRDGTTWMTGAGTAPADRGKFSL